MEGGLSCARFRRWRKLLDSLPLHVRHLHLVPQAPLCHVFMPPLQVGQLHVAGGPKHAQPIIESMAALFASTTFRLHSAAKLCVIKSPAFTLSADSAAAFRQLQCIQRLDARRLPAQLPSSLRRLWLEGDPWQLTRLAPNVFSNLPQLGVLVLHSVAVDVEQLPRSLWSLDVFKCVPHMCSFVLGPGAIAVIAPDTQLRVCYHPLTGMHGCFRAYEPSATMCLMQY